MLTSDFGNKTKNKVKKLTSFRTAMKSGPRLPQLEKARAQKQRLNTAINKQINKLKKKKKTNLIQFWSFFMFIPHISCYQI